MSTEVIILMSLAVVVFIVIAIVVASKGKKKSNNTIELEYNKFQPQQPKQPVVTPSIPRDAQVNTMVNEVAIEVSEEVNEVTMPEVKESVETPEVRDEIPKAKESEVPPLLPKEEVMVKVQTPQVSDTEFDVPPLVYQDNEEPMVDVSINEALDNETQEPQYDEIPEYIDPRTIKEDGEDVKVSEAQALNEAGVSEVNVYEDTHKEPNSPLNEEIKQEDLLDVAKKKDDVSPFDMKATKDHSINTDIKVEPPKEYIGNKTEIFDLEEIDRYRRKVIEQVAYEELSKYINSVNDAIINQTEISYENERNKVR